MAWVSAPHHTACASCASHAQPSGGSRASAQAAGGRRLAASAAGRPESSRRQTPLPPAAASGSSDEHLWGSCGAGGTQPPWQTTAPGPLLRPAPPALTLAERPAEDGRQQAQRGEAHARAVAPGGCGGRSLPGRGQCMQQQAVQIALLQRLPALLMQLPAQRGGERGWE